MIDYTPFYEAIQATSIKPWLKTLPQQVCEAFDYSRQGDLPKWELALERLPSLKPTEVCLNESRIKIGTSEDLDDSLREPAIEKLKAFHPWRKGPFDIFGIEIDTEWRSDFKWDRLKDAIQSLEGRLILDVGCGNGYHCWRMAGEGARLVVGIDPMLLFAMQFQVMQKYIQRDNVSVLPIGIEALPESLTGFDTVFSMGVLYHRRSPFDHLFQLKSLLRPGGELVLETLVIDGEESDLLVPEGRYAQMNNVWFIPSVSMLEGWLRKVGFQKVRCLDVTQTTSEEQRVTEWMGFHSLQDFLDPKDSDRTCEGHPAPRRAIVLASS